MIPQISERRIITYGLSASADIRAMNLSAGDNGMTFDVILSKRMAEPITNGDTEIKAVNFPMLGEHNVLNCLAAISVALEMGISIEAIRDGLNRFKGVGRRFDYKGAANGVMVIDDYGHHPVEIQAALNAARMLKPDNQVIAVVQPHRYSRLHDLFSDFCGCFNDADHVLVADVYAAGETPIEGADRDGLVAGLQAHGHPSPIALEAPETLAAQIQAIAKPGDVVICLGAGSSTQWADALPEQLAALQALEGASGGRHD